MTRHLVAVIAAVGWATPAQAACEGSVGSVELERGIHEAVRHIEGLDIERFLDEARHVEEQLPCLDEPIPRPTAAAVHRVFGLRAFGARDPGVSGYFAAARAVQPGYRFPSTLVPRGGAIDQAYEQAVPDDAGEEAPPPAAGFIAFDGTRTRVRPTGRPSILQRFDGEGSVVVTTYLEDGDALPSYDIHQGPPELIPDMGGKEGTPLVPSTRHRVPLVATASTAAVAGLTLTVAALVTEARYKDADDNPVPDEDLAGLRARGNALGIAAWAAGGGALVLGTTAAVTW